MSFCERVQIRLLIYIDVEFCCISQAHLSSTLEFFLKIKNIFDYTIFEKKKNMLREKTNLWVV